MTKLKKILLLVVVGVFAFSALNVDAEFFMHDNDTEISYNIAGFRVYVYGDEDLDIDNFEHIEGTNTLFIDPSDVTYGLDDAKVYELDGYKLVSAKLNILYIQEFFEEKVRQLKENLNESSDGKYFCALSVIYDINGLPSDASNIYDYDYNNVFNKRQTPREKISSSNLHQMVMTSIYDKESDSFDNNGSKNYRLSAQAFIPELAEEDRYVDYTIKSLDRYVALSDQYLFYSGNSYTSGSEKYRFMLHDLQNYELEGVFGSIKDCGSDTTCSTENNTTDDSTVESGDNDNTQNDSSNDDTENSSGDKEDSNKNKNKKHKKRKKDKQSNKKDKSKNKKHKHKHKNKNNNKDNKNDKDKNDKTDDSSVDNTTSDDNTNSSDNTATPDDSITSSDDFVTSDDTTSDNNNNGSSIIPDHTIDDDTTNDNNDNSSVITPDNTTSTDDNNASANTDTTTTNSNQSNNNTATTVVNTTSQTTSTGQKVSVPNTGVESNTGIAMFGMIFLTLGGGIVVWPEKKKESI